MELNPVIVSVILLCALCLLRVNVLLSLIIAAISAGLCAHMSIDKIMNTFIQGMGANSETALSYILLGAFAAAMTHTGLAQILARRIALFIGNNKYLLLFIIGVIAVMSQNLIPVHIAFIPILIPPLLGVMNKLKLDRRAVASTLAFGLKAPYIALPAGFGLIFQGLIADNMTQSGMQVLKTDVYKSTWFLGLAMLIGLLIAIFITYRKPREYKDIDPILDECNVSKKSLRLRRKHYVTLLGAFATLAVQLISGSLPLGALVGLGIIFGAKAVRRRHMDKLINEGIGLMGYVAFVMLIAAGFALVLKETGGVKFISVTLMLLVGLLITMGIGTSFGTIPILAVLFIPLCSKLGLSVPASVIVLAASAALGDAGSPASDTTLGPSAGLNADNQHNHIKDTCIPTFLHFNIALIVAAIIAVYIF